MERSADERNSTRSADLGRSQTKMPLKCSLPDARRARTKRPADTQQSRPNPQFSFDSKTCGLRKVRLRENPETFDTSRGRAAPPEIRDDVQKKEPAKDHCPHPSHPVRPDRWRNGLQSRSLFHAVSMQQFAAVRGSHTAS